MNIIVTGFGRFLTNEENPTREVLQLLPKTIKGHRIIPIELPVIFDECFDYLRPFIKEHNPKMIIMLGLAGGRNNISLERIAINMKDANGPDNIGYQPIDEIIKEESNNAFFSTLPLREIKAKLKEKNIPVVISNTAGLYVCNNIMYHVAHYIDRKSLDCISGFIHVPFMDSQKKPEGAFSLPIDVILEAIIDSIKVAIVKGERV